MAGKIETRQDSDGLVFYEGVGISRVTSSHPLLRISPNEIKVGTTTSDIDLKIFLGSSSKYVLFDAGDSDINVVAVGFDFSGSHTDHILDFSNATFTAEKQVIRAGSYGSPIALYPSGGLIYMYGSQDGDAGVSAITFFYGVTTGQGGMIGDSTLIESDAGSPGPRTLQGGQFIAGLKSGAYLRTLGGDATAGMYGVWAKVHAAGDSIASAGSRIAAIWLDNQMQGTVSGEEYAAFITTGGTTPKAVFGFETTGAGWTNLFYFDETSYDQAPVGATRTSPNSTAVCDGSLTVLINNKTLLIPLYNAVTIV